jgi:iron complex outermembrane recepter protein
VTAQLPGRRGAGSRVLGLLLLLPAGALSAQAGFPVDTLTRAELLRSGRGELAEILQALIPSLNFPRASGAGGSDHLRPASLRGLGADQLVVLVNGRRRVESALLNVNGAIGRGQATTDLNAIPLAAIERIELHREGDAARYGFGAVAGVIDIILRSDAHEVGAELGADSEGDGVLARAEASHAVRLGRGGRLQLSGELKRRGGTNRALPDRRPQYFPGDPRNEDPALQRRVTQRFGDPESNAVAGVLNAEQRIRGNIEAYGFASVSRRSNEAGELWRTPSDDRTVRALYPDGFLPLIAPKLFDGAALGGVRGRLLGAGWDASVGYARNSMRYDLEGTANASLGPHSPTRFDAGTLRADQFRAGLELDARVRRLGPIPPLGLRLGGEHRSDGYQIEVGEPDSYRYGAVPIQDGPHAGGIAQPGAQGFAAFRPGDAVIARRGMVGGFGELTTLIRKRLSLGAAGRLEYYRGLGTLGVYQLSGGLGPIRGITLHGSYGTGIRVPSLAQSFFSSGSTTVIGQLGFEDRTVPVGDPLAVVLGARPLRPEHSRNLNAGGSWTQGALRLSAEYYRIRVLDRIILSGSFDDAAVQSFLAQHSFPGIAGVRFFSNALSTLTTGVDAAASYRFRVREAEVGLRAAFNHNSTQVTLTDSIPGLLALFSGTLFDRVERARLERGQPRDNLILLGTATRGAWSVTARSQRFGSVTSFGKPVDGSLDQSYGAKWLSDLSVGYRRGRATLTLGADNLFNMYPDRNRFGDADTEGNSNFGMFPYSNVAPFGLGGRFVYVRFELVRSQESGVRGQGPHT